MPQCKMRFWQILPARTSGGSHFFGLTATKIPPSPLLHVKNKQYKVTSVLMTEIPTHQPNKKAGLTRGEFVVGTGGGLTLFGLVAYLNHYLHPQQQETPTALITETATPPTETQIPTTTPFPTEGPPPTPTAINPEATPTLEPKSIPTQIPKEEKYDRYFPKDTDLRFTIGSTNWQEPVTMKIGADSNLYTPITGSKEQSFIFHQPIVINKPGVWNDHLEAIKDFNNSSDPKEKAMVIPTFPSSAPTIIIHSNIYEVQPGHRIYPGEFFRRAMDFVQEGLQNPLIGKTISFEQVGHQDIPYRVEMEIVHMEKLTEDDFWQSLFYLDSNKSIYVDTNMAWKPDPQNPAKRLPLIPEEFRGPGHIIIANCDRDLAENTENKTKYATITVLKLKEVNEVTNLLSALLLGLRQGLLEA